VAIKGKTSISIWHSAGASSVKVGEVPNNVAQMAAGRTHGSFACTVSTAKIHNLLGPFLTTPSLLNRVSGG
jgi:hypothetical protein